MDDVMELTENILREGGFDRLGEWRIDPEHPVGVRFTEGLMPVAAGIYAHLVDGTAAYVGSAQTGLLKRLSYYQMTMLQRTAYRVRTEIVNALGRGCVVETFAMVPPANAVEWKGLPIDMVVGIEEGLIRKFRPAWNRRGLGRLSGAPTARGL